MQAPSRMDQLIRRLEHLNSLLDPMEGLEEGVAESEEPPGRVRKGKSGRTEQSAIGDMFTRAAQNVFRRIHNSYAGVLGLINPSDGRPQQEHCPDWAWFRPISFNRQSWIDTWPELQV